MTRPPLPLLGGLANLSWVEAAVGLAVRPVAHRPLSRPPRAEGILTTRFRTEMTREAREGRAALLRRRAPLVRQGTWESAVTVVVEVEGRSPRTSREPTEGMAASRAEVEVEVVSGKARVPAEREAREERDRST